MSVMNSEAIAAKGPGSPSKSEIHKQSGPQQTLSRHRQGSTPAKARRPVQVSAAGGGGLLESQLVSLRKFVEMANAKHRQEPRRRRVGDAFAILFVTMQFDNLPSQ